MNFFGKIVSSVSSALDFNPSTLSGAIDIIVVDNGTEFKSTPFYVRFGKLMLLNPLEKIVTLSVNGVESEYIMKLSRSGDAYFSAGDGASDVVGWATPDGIHSNQSSIPASPLNFEDKVKSASSSITSVKSTSSQSSDPNLSPLLLSKPNAFSTSVPIANLSDQRQDVMEWWTNGLATPSVAEDKLKKSTVSVDTISTPVPAAMNFPSPLKNTDCKEIPDKNTSIGGNPPKSSFFKSLFGIFNRSKASEQKLSDAKLNEDSKLKEINVIDETKVKEITVVEHSAPIKVQSVPNSPNVCGLVSTESKSVPSSPITRNRALSSPIVEDMSTLNISTLANSMNDFEFTRQNSATSLPSVASLPPLFDPSSSFQSSNFTRNTSDGIDVLKVNSALPISPISNSKEINLPNKSPSTFHCAPLQNLTTLNGDFELSLCGSFLTNDMTLNSVIFNQNRVLFEQFSSDATIIYNPNLIIRIGNRMFPGKIAFPLLLSYLVYGKPISDAALQAIANLQVMAPTEFREPTNAVANNSSGFFSWFRREGENKLELKSLDSKPTDEVKSVDIKSTDLKPADSKLVNDIMSPIKLPQEKNYIDKSSVTSTPLNDGKAVPKLIVKTNKPSSNILKGLCLNYGCNSISFSVSSRLQGKQTVMCNIFLWKSDVKIVISDVDGTITKSDLLGNLMPLVGRDWSHVGVANFFTNISFNDYQFLYLTSRSIGQASLTRTYLQNLRQCTDYSGLSYQDSLPIGPIIMCPDSLMHAFKREVIDRKPQEFKIGALSEVKQLFPLNYQPFYAGFGNRDTDTVSYQAVGILPQKIFIIDPSGRISQLNKTYSKSYDRLNDIVHDMFPPKQGLEAGYTDNTFWKIPYSTSKLSALD